MTKKRVTTTIWKENVRTVWDDEEEKWYFSIVDVVAVLTDSSNPQTYWRVLKTAWLKKEMKPLQIVTLSNFEQLMAKWEWQM